jgi:hypothetical protein
MIVAVLLVLVALLYRIVIGVAGMNEMQWLHNFSPFAAIALCGAIYFPRRIAVLGPLAAFFVSDLILNAYYMTKTPHVESVISMRMIPEYLALGLSAGMGLWIRKNPRLSLMLGASVVGSIAFYLITNTGDWLMEPRYTKTAAGWLQALTTGLPGYPSTLLFFRNTAASDLLFTLLFAACMMWQPRKQPVPVLQVKELVSR